MNEDVFLKFPELQTERLRLIRHHSSHARDMFLLRTDPDVMKYMDDYTPKSLDEIDEKITENIKAFDEKIGMNWVIQLSESKTILGYMSIWRIDKKNNRGEIGYALKKEYWNLGLAKEAAIAIINFAFDQMKLHTLMANTNVNNGPSQKLLTSLGFEKEAHFRQDYFFDGKYLDSMIYGLIRDDWHF